MDVSAIPAAELAALRACALRAANAGAAVIELALDLPRNVMYKGALDLVTDTDKAAEKAVEAVLRAEYPGHAILGEEGGVSGDASSPFLWCVDPVDGTTNFAHAYPAFACSVAVTVRGRPVAGCVVEFAGGPRAWTRRTYTAALGQGSECNGAPLRPSGATELRRSLLATGFGYDHGADWEENMGLWRTFTDECQGVRRLGAASVDFCHVALGCLDCYWEYQLKPWDMAAGALVLTEAGGVVTKGDGSPFSVFSRSVIACNNATLHAAVLEKVGAATRRIEASGLKLDDWFMPEGYKAV
jgi:myo-inositol-1(or 4)-monophosphatase